MQKILTITYALIGRSKTICTDVFDVIFNEDKSLKMKEILPADFNIISKMALAMLEKETSVKKSKPQKRIKAASSDCYGEKLFEC